MMTTMIQKLRLRVMGKLRSGIDLLGQVEVQDAGQIERPDHGDHQAEDDRDHQQERLAPGAGDEGRQGDPQGEGEADDVDHLGEVDPLVDTHGRYSRAASKSSATSRYPGWADRWSRRSLTCW